MRNRSRASVALGLIALVFAVFIQVRHHDFVDLDDLGLLVHNPDLHASGPVESVRIAFTTTSLYSWIPLTVLSLAIDRAVHGGDPAGYLLTNLALHALATVLLFLALEAMSGALWCSAFVAAVFGVHPLHVESVAWVSERKDVLSGLFFMATLAAHARHGRRPGAGSNALVLLCFALGLLAKPMLVTLPLVLLLLDAWPLRRLGRRAWLEKIPMIALAAAASAVTFAVQRAGGATAFGDAIPLGWRVANALDSYVVYAIQSLWPTGLAVLYPHPGSSLPLLRVAADAAVLIFATGVALRLRRSRPYLLVGWLWYLGMLVPVIGLVQVGVQARADRYMYLPQVGLAIALAWGLADLARTRAQRRALAAAGAGAVLALGAAAFVQVGYWRDSLALFERGLEIAPGSDTFHAQLGAVHLRADRFERAEHHYREAYRLNPAAGRAKLVRFQLGMGKLLEARGEPAAAALRYADALGLDPTSRRASASLHRAIGLAGRSSEARAWIARSVRGTPGDARLHEALGFAALVDGQHAEAVAQSREALRVDPALSAARNNLAWLLATAPDPSLRDPAEALRVAEELVAESDAPSAQLLDTLAATQAAAGRAEAAVQTAQRAIDVALRAQAGELALAIRARLAHYRAGRPWIEPAASPESAD